MFLLSIQIYTLNVYIHSSPSSGELNILYLGILCFNLILWGKSIHIFYFSPQWLLGWWPDASFHFDMVKSGCLSSTSRWTLAVLPKSRFELSLDQDEKVPLFPNWLFSSCFIFPRFLFLPFSQITKGTSTPSHKT